MSGSKATIDAQIDAQKVYADSLAEIDAMFTTLAAGRDIAPARRIACESRIELLLEYDAVAVDVLREAVDRLHQKHFQQPIDSLHWQWCDAEHRFFLPAHQTEAPVYKG